MERSKKLALAFIMIIAMLSSYIVPSAMNKGHYINGVLLVNKKYGLPKDYNPGESKEARSEFERMKKDASKSNIYLNAFSTFRSYSYQYNLYWNYVKRDGQEKADTYSAKPGYSEHQTGLAFDIGGKNSKLWANDGFHNTTEAKWLANNAHNYGFILRYPKGKEHITGYKYESWHYRYVGVELAKKIYNSGLCLEEYLGEYKNGWHKQDNKWYYYQDNNKVYGWKKISGSWYYLDENGQMVTGWKKISGSWYYLNEDGQMVTGWKKVSGSWYYLNEDGQMATGWKKVSGSWYYLNEDGQMATGWKKVSGSWYYLNEDGQMVTGWKKVSGSWYYLNEDGRMAENETIEIDGEVYTFDEFGNVIKSDSDIENKLSI